MFCRIRSPTFWSGHGFRPFSLFSANKRSANFFFFWVWICSSLVVLEEALPSPTLYCCEIWNYRVADAVAICPSISLDGGKYSWPCCYNGKLWFLHSTFSDGFWRPSLIFIKGFLLLCLLSFESRTFSQCFCGQKTIFLLFFSDRHFSSRTTFRRFSTSALAPCASNLIFQLLLRKLKNISHLHVLRRLLGLLLSKD